MFGESKEEKQRKQTRERVRRFREKQKPGGEQSSENNGQGSVNTVTSSLQPVTTGVTASTKMICKCRYFLTVNGQLICSQCGRPAEKQPKIRDKILPRPEFK